MTGRLVQIFCFALLLLWCHQLKQKKHHNAKARDRELTIDKEVFVRNYRAGDHWLAGVIVRRTGPVSSVVKLSDGWTRHCHQDLLAT